MIEAQYAVIRYIADPARKEPLNIGVVLWHDLGCRLQLDSDAITRVVRENPYLTADSLMYVEPFIRNRLALDRPVNGSVDLRGRVRGASQFPVVLSDPLMTMVIDESEGSLDEEVADLIARIVRPAKHRRGGVRAGAIQTLAKRWKPWIGHQIARDHLFGTTKSGNPRKVDFFANSGTNVAVDVLALAVKEAKDIQQRADAEAYKVEDVIHRHNDVRFLVHCDMKTSDSYHEANLAAIRSLTTAGATVFTDVEKTADELMRQLSPI